MWTPVKAVYYPHHQPRQISHRCILRYVKLCTYISIFDIDPDHHHNLNKYSFYRCRAVLKLSPNSSNLLGNAVNRQTDRKTSNASKKITSPWRSLVINDEINTTQQASRAHDKRDLYNTCIVSQLSRNKYCLNQINTLPLTRRLCHCVQ